MKPHHLCRLAGLGLLLAGSLRATDFEVRLGLTQAHLEEVFFGCHAKGTDGYDRELDDLAPPPGIDTGYVGFVPPGKLPYFYKDVRGPLGPHEWRLLVRVAKERPVQVSWDPKTLPAGWAFTLTSGARHLAMAETSTLAVAESSTLVIRAAATAPTPDLGNP